MRANERKERERERNMCERDIMILTLSFEKYTYNILEAYFYLLYI
jgi:hypothetical protein